MTTMKLSAQARTPGHKGAARQLRRTGLVPGILYGHGEDPVAFSVDHRELDALIRKREGTVIVEVDIPGKDVQQTIIRELQRDPVTGSILHVDFQHVLLTEKIMLEVPIHVLGTATGVKNEGGILEHHLRAVEIRCLPGEIPPHIDLEVSEMAIGDSLHVRDLPIDRDKIEVVTEDTAVVVSVIPPRIVEEPVAAEAAEGAEEAAGVAAEGAEEGGKGEKESKDSSKESS